MPRLMKSLSMMCDEQLNQVLHFQCGTCLNEIEATLTCQVKAEEVTTYRTYEN